MKRIFAIGFYKEHSSYLTVETCTWESWE